MSDSRDRAQDAILFRAAELFLGGLSAPEVADQLNADFPGRRPTSRQAVYKLLSKARSRGFLRLVPALETTVADHLSERYSLDRSRLHVVNAQARQAGGAVSEVAAETALKLVKDLALRQRRSIGVGVGPGRATLDFARRFGQLLESDPAAPKLKLFAISAGCPPLYPEYDPNSFFNLFPLDVVVKRIGMFAEPLVRARDFNGVRASLGFREVLGAQDEIDLVVSSMGDFHDEHDLLRNFLIASGQDVARLEKAGWVGNVQFRPYTEGAAVQERQTEFRAVTLFELDDLARIASTKDRHVLLMARSCVCGLTRARALRPLLEHRSLRVFSELVMDASTGRDLIGTISGTS